MHPAILQQGNTPDVQVLQVDPRGFEPLTSWLPAKISPIV